MHTIIYEGIEYRPYDHLYAVAEDGRLLRANKPWTPVQRPDGYLQAGRRRLVHRMVALCWVPNPDELPHVHHKDEDRTNNHASNLEWVSPQNHLKDYHPDSYERLGKYERTEETREKLRKYRTGRKTSEATKQKQREASLRLGCRPPSPKGREASERAKQKLRERRSRACEINGVQYPSFTEAGKALSERPLTVRKRCLSPNFPNYRVLDV